LRHLAPALALAPTDARFQSIEPWIVATRLVLPADAAGRQPFHL